jgi:methionine synthase II (cobalamin-independent)
VRTLGDPASVAANPDCGLRTRSWDVSEAKLATIVEATRIVRGAFGAEAEAITGSP